MENCRSERNNVEGAEWYAIYTRHQHEKTVTDNLSRPGVEVSAGVQCRPAAEEPKEVPVLTAVPLLCLFAQLL